ncbi:MAG: hypothetical protein KF825_08740 [Ferruginibacter sp.]|nr:hypothetical protein [Ferruginibacter sp.]
MLPQEYYTQRIVELKASLVTLTKRKSLFAWLRLATIISMGLCWYFFQPLGWLYILIPVLLLAILFTRLIYIDLKNKSHIEHTGFLISINEAELKALAHDYLSFPDGNEFINKEHLYANDLDIFGHASLYQFINRTNSEMGNATLANWMLNPADKKNIMQRQEAVQELKVLHEWRQQLQALGAGKKIQVATKTRLQQWFQEKEQFIKNKAWQVLQYLLPAFIITAIILNILEMLSGYARNYCLLIAAIAAFYIYKKVTPIHQQVSKITEELEVLTESIQLIEETNFKSGYLKQLQNQFKFQSSNASLKLNQLKKILERFDLRYNPVVFIPLAIIMQWDLQQAIALEKWKNKYHTDVLNWFNALGEFEALNSLAILSFNHPGWCFPEIKDEFFFIEGKNIGHPLIENEKCVTNQIHINKTGKLMLVTGSNMAGKSTYLRSIGINTVLAMAGAPVCASSFSISPVQVISSMRITDNLEESTSTFYAELKKLKTVIDKVNDNEKVFILLDEILRGTNSFDRHTGSAALIKQLIKHHAVGIIATHDIELAALKNEFPENILNYHFDVQVSNDELYFDYKLKDGICNSMNASILMKKIGIEL